jgi:hypothetical protein
MSVGIYDADLSTFALVPFNLEAMKLSAYYKKKGEIVVLSPYFTPEKNTKFIFRKDYDDGRYPNRLTAPNVEYGGLAFSNNVYQPLPPEIECMKPDTSIYAKAEAIMMAAPGREREKKKIFQNMMEAEHCRLSLDGKTITIIELDQYPGKVFTWRDLEVVEIKNRSRYDALCGAFLSGQSICGNNVSKELSQDSTELPENAGGVSLIDENGNIISNRYIRILGADVEDPNTDGDNITDIELNIDGDILD